MTGILHVKMESGCKWQKGKSSFGVCSLFFMLGFEYKSFKINHISHSLFIPREISRQLSSFGNINFCFIKEIVFDIIDDIFCFKCDECQKTLSNKSSLRRHMKYAHEGYFFMKNHFFLKEEKRSYVCPTCLKSVMTKVILIGNQYQKEKS